MKQTSAAQDCPNEYTAHREQLLAFETGPNGPEDSNLLPVQMRTKAFPASTPVKTFSFISPLLHLDTAFFVHSHSLPSFIQAQTWCAYALPPWIAGLPVKPSRSPSGRKAACFAYRNGLTLGGGSRLFLPYDAIRG